MRRPYRAHIVTVLLCLVFPGLALYAQTQLTPEIRRQTIEDLAALLPERYAYKETGGRLRDLLLQNLKAGKYDKYTQPLDFSTAVTADLRSLQSDRHLALNYDRIAGLPTPTPTPGGPTPTPVPPEERARRVSVFNRQMNYGFKDVRFLYGNIGYLKFDYFDSYLDYSRPVVDASMAFFKNCDALIIDLRENGGGSGEMVNYIAGFFFSERTHTGSSYNRLTDSSTEEYIDAQPKEKQLGDIPLYILTSKNTISAAEALAYQLKYLKKAVIVGETSAGAANPGRVTRLNDLFTAFIPNRHGVHIVTKTNWEGTGVPVDIPTSAGDALRVAKLQALNKLRDVATNPIQKAKYTSYITYLENVPSKRSFTQKELLGYAGDYQGGRNIIVWNGRLVYDHLGEAGGEMHYISPDIFMLAEGDTTISFTRDDTGKVVEMSVKWALTGESVNAKRIHE